MPRKAKGGVTQTSEYSMEQTMELEYEATGSPGHVALSPGLLSPGLSPEGMMVATTAAPAAPIIATNMPAYGGTRNTNYEQETTITYEYTYETDPPPKQEPIVIERPVEKIVEKIVHVPVEVKPRPKKLTCYRHEGVHIVPTTEPEDPAVSLFVPASSPPPASSRLVVPPVVVKDGSRCSMVFLMAILLLLVVAVIGLLIWSLIRPRRQTTNISFDDNGRNPTVSALASTTDDDNKGGGFLERNFLEIVSSSFLNGNQRKKMIETLNRKLAKESSSLNQRVSAEISDVKNKIHNVVDTTVKTMDNTIFLEKFEGFKSIGFWSGLLDAMSGSLKTSNVRKSGILNLDSLVSFKSSNSSLNSSLNSRTTVVENGHNSDENFNHSSNTSSLIGSVGAIEIDSDGELTDGGDVVRNRVIPSKNSSFAARVIQDSTVSHENSNQNGKLTLTKGLAKGFLKEETK